MKLPSKEFGLDSDEPEDELEKLEKAKSKLIMDFGLESPKMERVTLEVLQQLIREKPEKMTQAVRHWLHSGGTNR